MESTKEYGTQQGTIIQFSFVRGILVATDDKHQTYMCKKYSGRCLFFDYARKCIMVRFVHT